MFLWYAIELFLFYLSMFSKEPIYKELMRIASPNKLMDEKSIFKLIYSFISFAFIEI